MQPHTYEESAREYAALVADEERADFSPSRDMILPVLLSFLGDVHGLHVLDAGCGEGRVSRNLGELGAHVLGVDISPTLIEIARQRSVGPRQEYRLADLTDPPEGMIGEFDLVVAHLVIDDLPDYRSFVRTLCLACRPTGRIVVSKNNPYSAVLRNKVASYFDSGRSTLYQGLSSRGVRVYYYHRTLEEHITAFREHGFVLSRFSDVPPPPDRPSAGSQLRDAVERYRQFPFFTVMEFIRHPA